MSNLAIRVENLGKQYRIGRRESAPTLRQVLTNTLRFPARKPVPTQDEWIWALRDVSFEIKSGEAVGFIGKNGAGKSTLLKILSRITQPTEGSAHIWGRVGSLLEVGTGFHPELSGRENIFLNGSILGMKNAAIRQILDEIIAFAEIEKFIDTPVKHYSSGMYLRLAFAVAAHLNPDILLVDEVLAVGDAEFQKKCLVKIDQVTRVGRTVLFVSHNLGALANLCPRAVLLAQGQLVRDGPANAVIREYMASGKPDQGERVWRDPLTMPGNDKLCLCAARIVCDGKTTADVDIQKPIHIEIEFFNRQPGARITTSIHLLDKLGIPVLASANLESVNLTPTELASQPLPVGWYRAICVLPENFLNEGRYSINIILLTEISRIQVFQREAIAFTVHDTGAMRREFGGEWIGVVRPKLAWHTQRLESPSEESAR